MCEIAAIIPCFNEAHDIHKVLTSFKYYLELFTKDNPEYICDIYVYDNCSTDNTVEIVNKFIEDNASCNVKLKFEAKPGKGNVVRTAFNEIDADYYIMCDGDNTYDLSNLSKMLNLAIFNDYDMIIGDRLSTEYFCENKRLAGSWGNRLIRWLISHKYKIDFKDALSGYRIFSRKLVKSIVIKSSGFDIETELNIFAAKKRMKIDFVPVHYKDRQGSFSKLKTIPDGFRILYRACTMLIGG